jgi:uncharacterized protein
VDTTGTLGRVLFDPMAGAAVRYAADTPELLALAPGETIEDHFTYTIRDLADGDNGPTSTATVTVTVTGADDGGIAVTMAPVGVQDPWAGQPDLLL